MFRQKSFERHDAYGISIDSHDETDVAAALVAARDAERDRAHQRDIQDLAAELATIKSTAKWNQRIAEDELEARWRNKTDALIMELNRLRQSENDLKLELVSRDAKIHRLQSRVESLESTIHGMLLKQNERASDGNRNENADEKHSVTIFGERDSGKSSKYSVSPWSKVGYQKKSYSKLYKSRQRMQDKEDRKLTSKGSETTKTDNKYVTQPQYDINGRRVK